MKRDNLNYNKMSVKRESHIYNALEECEDNEKLCLGLQSTNATIDFTNFIRKIEALNNDIIKNKLDMYNIPYRVVKKSHTTHVWSLNNEVENRSKSKIPIRKSSKNLDSNEKVENIYIAKQLKKDLFHKNVEENSYSFKQSLKNKLFK